MEIRAVQMGKEITMLTVNIGKAREEKRILSLEASGQHFRKKN